MKQFSTLLLISLMFSLSVNAQGKRDKFNDRFDDVFEEEDNGNLTLRFFNALTGEPIKNGAISIANFEDFYTDEEGKIIFPVPDEDGFIQVTFKKEKYITCDFNIEIVAGTIFFNRFSVSPEIDLKDLRMVLDWDSAPRDLDAHFIKTNGYHISYRNTKILLDGTGELDKDDMDGFGPETITVRDIDDLGEYTYKVQDYTNRNNMQSSALSKSKATVKVFGKNKLLYVFQIPNMGAGNTWEVFKIHEGEFIEINQLKKVTYDE